MLTPSHESLHVAIIMDGNGRWAQNRHLPRMAGHKAGLDAARKIIIHAAQSTAVHTLTLFAFSTENWSRPAKEVHGLMELFALTLEKEAKMLYKNRVLLRVLGDREALNPALRQRIEQVEALTAQGDGLKLNVAINYGGRWDILQATRNIARCVAEGHLSVNQIDERLMNQFLCTGGEPDPDLFIRTSGEMRLSNFVLWQCVYSELYFTPKLWPDFSEHDFEVALQDYAKRQRRYGDIPVSCEQA